MDTDKESIDTRFLYPFEIIISSSYWNLRSVVQPGEMTIYINVMAVDYAIKQITISYIKPYFQWRRCRPTSNPTHTLYLLFWPCPSVQFRFCMFCAGPILETLPYSVWDLWFEYIGWKAFYRILCVTYVIVL